MAESVTFTSPDGNHTRVANTPGDIVKMRYNGWAEKSASQVAAESEPLPSPSANKDEWVERAESLGLDTDGKTKAELQGAVEAKLRESGQTDAPQPGAPQGGQTGSETAPTDAEVTASTASKSARR